MPTSLQYMEERHADIMRWVIETGDPLTVDCPVPECAGGIIDGHPCTNPWAPGEAAPTHLARQFRLERFRLAYLQEIRLIGRTDKDQT